VGIDKEYPKWAWVDFKFQDANFFQEVRQLLAKGLDPKHELIHACYYSRHCKLLWQCQNIQNH
jgi:hypothetical protein